MQRRRFVQGAGALSVVAVGGTVWRALDQGMIGGPPDAAYAPWENWRTDAGAGPIALVRAGILAASPHNTQPWRFRVSDRTIDVLADASRHLGAMDPYRREMHIGLGCVIENMVQAAPAYALRAQVALASGGLGAHGTPGTDEVVARIRLTPGARAVSSLFEAIPARHTDRGPYDTGRPVPRETLAALKRLGDGGRDLGITLLEPGRGRERFGELIVEATERIGDDPEMLHDSHRWYRHEYDAIRRQRDGVTLAAAGLAPATTAVARFLPRPSASSGFGYWLDSTRNVHVPTAAAFGLIAAADPRERAQALRVGRLWQRMHLWATAGGLSMHPINQPPEIADRERQLGHGPRMAERLRGFGDDPGLQPTFAFRLGHPVGPTAASPRRGIDEVIA